MYYYDSVRSKTMNEETPNTVEEPVRKRGAQLGNQNARTHGFYSKELDETEKQQYEQATEVEGLEAEIALLRIKIQSLVAHDPENIRLITQATNALARLLMTKFNTSKADKQGLEEAFNNVLNNIAIPFGIRIITGLGK